MTKHVFTLTVINSLEGCQVAVDCDGDATGMDAVAAIRALVDETSRLTGRSATNILGMVEHQLIARGANESVFVV